MAQMFTCKKCGVEFRGHASTNPKYCSRECYRTASQRMQTCHHCGKEFVREGYKLGRYKHSYCSPYCVTAAQRKRVSVTCTNCGKEFEVTEGEIKAYKQHFCSRACRRTRVSMPCGQCGQAVEVFRHKLEESATGKFFCSKTCFNAWNAGEKVHVSCLECGKEFLRFKHHAERQENQFCSQRCMGMWRSRHNRGENHPRWVNELAVKCDNCGKEVRKNSRNKLARNRHNFCSAECDHAWKTTNETYVGENNPNWKGGHPDYYGPNWYRQQRAARKRDGYKCQCCGKTQKKSRALDVHHIIPFRIFGYVRDQNDLYLQANDLTNLVTLCQQCHKRAESQLIPIQPTLLSF